MSCTNCTFKETDDQWIYKTSSHYEDSSHQYDVVVTVTDSTATEHNKTEVSGWDAHGNCTSPIAPVSDTTTKTITRENYTGTYHCEGSDHYFSESVETFDFRAESSRHKSRKEMFDKHMKACKAAEKYYGAGPFF